jgi:hypothetical protein
MMLPMLAGRERNLKSDFAFTLQVESTTAVNGTIAQWLLASTQVTLNTETHGLDSCQGHATGKAA